MLLIHVNLTLVPIVNVCSVLVKLVGTVKVLVSSVCVMFAQAVHTVLLEHQVVTILLPVVQQLRSPVERLRVPRVEKERTMT
jgi:hypothetical protein